MKNNKKQIYAAILGISLAAGWGYSPVQAEDTQDMAPMYSLDGIVVTANRTPQKKKEVNADVSVISRQEIEQMHMTNVEEALRTVPGVQFTSYGGNGGLNANMSGIRINGSKEIVVLVDGVRVTDFQADDSGYTFAALTNNMDNVERIEVVRGSAGTLYGSSAKGGVINIITRKIDTTKTTLDVSAGSFSTRQYKLNTMGKDGQLGYHVYYDRKTSGDFKDGSGKKWDSDIKSTSYGAKVEYEFNPKHKVSASFDQTKSDFNGYDFVYVCNYKGDYKTNSITLQDEATLSNRWKNNFTYRHSTTKGMYSQENVALYNADNDNIYNFISEQATYNSERHTLVLGIDYSQAKGVVTNSDTTKHNGKMKNISYYIQDDWMLMPHITLTGGLRYDKPTTGGELQDDPDSRTSKSYKLSWDITKKDKVYAGRSDFFILPSMYQLLNEDYGNKNLQYSYGRTSTIGYNHAFNDRSSLTLNWFETVTERGIGLSAGKYVNTSGLSRGWNAEYTSEINKHWNVNFGWSHLFQEYNENDSYTWGYAPKNMATFGVYYTNEKITAALDGYYFMRKVNPNYPDGWPVDDYAIFNISTSYKPQKDLNIYLKVNNLFDKMYSERTHVIYSGGKPGDWYAMPGRNIVVGMQYSF